MSLNLNLLSMIASQRPTLSFLNKFKLGADGMAFSSRTLSSPKTSVVRGLLTGTSTETDSETFLGSVVPSDVQELYNNAMYFDGTDDYVEYSGMSGDLDSVEFTFIKGDETTSTSTDTPFSWSQSNDQPGIHFGSWTGALTDEVVSIGYLNGKRTAVIGITIPPGRNTLRVEWNNTESRYDIIINGVTQTVVRGGTGHVLKQSLGSGYVGRRFSSSSRNFRGSLINISINDGEYVYVGGGNQTINWTNTGTESGANGTVNGSPALFSGQGFSGTSPIWYDQTLNNEYMIFNGTDVFVQSDNNIDLNPSNSWELEGTFLLNRSGDDCLFGAKGQPDFSMRARGGQLDLAYGGFSDGVQAWRSTGISIPTDAFVKIKITWDGIDEMEVFFDDVSQGTKTLTAPNFSSPSPLTVGARNGFNEFWDGYAYDISVKVNGVTVLSYDGYGNTDSDWLDTSGNNNNGTVNGSPTSSRRNLVQATEADQPVIVTDGATTKIGNMDAVEFDGSNYMTIPKELFTSAENYLAVSLVISDVTTQQWLFCHYDTGLGRSWGLRASFDALVVTFGDPSNGAVFGTYSASSTVDFTQNIVVGFTFNNGTCSLYINGVEVSGTGSVPASLYTDSTADMSLMCRLNSNTPTEFSTGNVGEVIYTTNSAIDIVALQKNQMRAAGIE